jgi:hypothetical protein
MHRAIRDAEQQIEGFRFNTLVASLMQMTSQMEEVWSRLGSRTRAEALDVLRPVETWSPYLVPGPGTDAGLCHGMPMPRSNHLSARSALR